MTPTFLYEDSHGGIVAGVDEAGCGPWAGPVVAGAAILDQARVPAVLIKYLNDSKKVTTPRRQFLYNLLMQEEGLSCWTAHGIATVEEVDALNIRQAAKLAMTRAVGALTKTPCFLLIDGTQMIGGNIPGMSLIKGDQLSYSIAAASIIAKVTRDKIMCELAEKYPHYGWQTNAGYGTKTHQMGLQAYGITPHHRKSFAPIKRVIEGCLDIKG